jgi:uncharacterized protein YndB with AHSA1/START domain
MSGETLTPDHVEAGTDEGVRASISVAAPPGQVWQHLTSTRGTEALLGDGARLGSKGESWHANDGTYGVVRSWHPTEQIRVTWHPREDGPLSMLDVQLHPDGDATRVEVYHEGRGIAGDPRGDHDHWQQPLDTLVAGIPG